jgi:hypothetical protein
VCFVFFAVLGQRLRAAIVRVSAATLSNLNCFLRATLSILLILSGISIVSRLSRAVSSQPEEAKAIYKKAKARGEHHVASEKQCRASYKSTKKA